MMELKPCPFCGGYEKHSEDCFVFQIEKYTDFVLLFKENPQFEYDKAWNTRAERTCKLRKTSWDNGCRTWGVVCSVCGHPFEHESGECWEFCPSCGAKVVK